MTAAFQGQYLNYNNIKTMWKWNCFNWIWFVLFEELFVNPWLKGCCRQAWVQFQCYMCQGQGWQMPYCM